MIIKQLSVFLENESGRLSEVLDLLAKNKINISAIALADTEEYGLLRMIVSDYNKAVSLLKEQHFTVNLTDVISFFMPNNPGSLAKALDYLSVQGVGIEYIYAFNMGEKAMAVLRTDDSEKAIEILKAHKLELIRANELYNF